MISLEDMISPEDTEWDSFWEGLKERLLLIVAQIVLLTVLAGIFGGWYILSN